MVDVEKPTTLHLRLTVGNGVKTLELQDSDSTDRLPLASVAVAVLRTGPAAQAAWRTLCAEAIAAAELAALGGEES